MSKVLNEKILKNPDNESLKTTLLGYYIRFCPNHNFDELMHMVKNDTMTSNSSVTVNKTQRYMCMRRLLKSGKYDNELPALLEAEGKRDYSNDDDLEQLSHQACVVDTAEKQKLFDSYLVKDKWSQYELESSIYHFYHRNDRKQCELFADQWLG